MYIPLHAHTSKGSVGDSILNIDDYVNKAKQYGLNSIAVTDHGSLSAIYSFYDKCIKAVIKPIIGCEVYFCDDNKDKSTTERYHLILLAKNNEGLSNLISICNNASIDGYYYRPRTDLSVLKKYGKGIIALSACVYGKVPQLLYKGLTYQADKLALQYKEIFDEFYLEIQPGNFTEQHEINSHLIEMSKRLNIGMVVTNDIHYLTEEDAYYHDIHCKIKRKQTVDDPNVYPDTCYWFMDEETIKNQFSESYVSIIDKAILNTARIADQCNVMIDNKIRMPSIDLNNGKSDTENLRDICYNEFDRVEAELSDPSRYMEQLIYELDTIDELGFSGYFLIVIDLINYARKNNIPVGPGRGSVCGSLVAYLSGIVETDPIKCGLLFERFLSKYRKGSVPDCVNY